MTDIVSLFLIALSLAMDAMAVSVTNGIKLLHCRLRDGVRMGLFFGIFQFIMPLLGFYLGGRVTTVVGVMAPWLSSAILAVLGVRMIIEAHREETDQNPPAKNSRLTTGELLLQAVATSIDALAVGVSLSMASHQDMAHIYLSSLVIGLVAFACSLIGAMAGRRLGSLFERWAQTIGGFVLVLIGIKILAESFLR